MPLRLCRKLRVIRKRDYNKTLMLFYPLEKALITKKLVVILPPPKGLPLRANDIHVF